MKQTTKLILQRKSKELIYSNDNFEVIGLEPTNEELNAYILDFKRRFNEQEQITKQKMESIGYHYNMECCDNILFEDINFYKLVDIRNNKDCICSELDIVIDVSLLDNQLVELMNDCLS